MSSSGSSFISPGQSLAACAVTAGVVTGRTGRFARADVVGPATVAGAALPPPTTCASTITTTTTGTHSAVAISAARRSGSFSVRAVLSDEPVLSDVDDRARQRAGDPVDRLHARNDQPAELVDGL